MKPIILIACLSPIVIIWSIMKINFTKSYVKNPYEDVDESEEEYGDRTDFK